MSRRMKVSLAMRYVNHTTIIRDSTDFFDKTRALPAYVICDIQSSVERIYLHAK